MSQYDIGIRCGHLLTMAAGQDETLKDYFIGIKGADIVTVAPYPRKKPKCKKFIDASKQAVLPGLINGHCHQGMNLFRGIADDLPFHTWLFDHILPLEKKNITASFVSTAVELALLESIKFGVTTTCDMYFFVDSAAKATDKAGTRALLSQAISNLPSPDAPNPMDAFSRLEKLQKQYSNHERIQIAYGPHAPYTCDDVLLREILDHNTRKAPICIHVSETKKEVEDSLKEFGMTPPQRLEKLGVLESQVVMFHGVHITDDDIKLLSKVKNLGLVHNPESNMKLGVGVLPVLKILDAKIPVGLGTDSVSSNNNLNILGEVATVAKLHKVVTGDLTAIPARLALLMATRIGAEALGMADRIGSIEEGKLADIITIDLDLPHMQPLYDLPSQLAYSATGMEVNTVLCHGRLLMKDRKVLTLNEAAVLEASKKRAKKLLN